jgi:hypothetical protein
MERVECDRTGGECPARGDQDVRVLEEQDVFCAAVWRGRTVEEHEVDAVEGRCRGLLLDETDVAARPLRLEALDDVRQQHVGDRLKRCDIDATSAGVELADAALRRPGPFEEVTARLQNELAEGGEADPPLAA